MKLEQAFPELRKEGGQIYHSSFTSASKDGEASTVNMVIQRQTLQAFGDTTDNLLLIHRNGGFSQFNFSQIPTAQLFDDQWFTVDKKSKK